MHKFIALSVWLLCVIVFVEAPFYRGATVFVVQTLAFVCGVWIAAILFAKVPKKLW